VSVEREVAVGFAEPVAARVVSALAARGEHLAVAESLTGGLLCARIVDVPGASVVLRGGVVAYASEVKASLLGVDGALLASSGAVHPLVAEQMAIGVAARLGAEHALATTGVAGPDPADGIEPGRVYIAHAGPGGVVVETAQLPGDRLQIRTATVRRALELLLDRLDGLG
jgi:nicotinamide-nucleotide amidase